jgi:hypothetical protein
MDFIMQCPSTNIIITKLRDFVEDNIYTESDLNKSTKFIQNDTKLQHSNKETQTENI